ncbi:MAG: flagellin [Candidatus Sericytochromatia bacterium]|nr:flagellin [Candidatus Sericytochromatia bacterium]
MRINTNMNALIAQRNMAGINNNLSKSLERLSSGVRISNAKDDAAGLAIAEGMTARIRGMNVAEKNIQDGMSFFNAREGALEQLTTLAQRMRELAVTGSNDFNSQTVLDNLGSEFNTLKAEFNRTIATSNFNGIKTLSVDTVLTTELVTVRIGPGVAVAPAAVDPDVDEVLQFTRATSTALEGSITDMADPATVALFEAALSELDIVLEDVITERAANGTFINRLELALANLQVNRENLQSAQSRIRDTDMAAETINLTRQQIILQTSTAMLAQANAQPQSILALFQ